MHEHNRNRETSISKANTLRQTGEYWDSHSLADYADNVREVSLEIDADARRDRTAIASDRRSSTPRRYGSTKMPDKLSRICWNTSGWRKPTGDAVHVETGRTYVATHRFGHEEWLFNFEWLISGYRYGFLQPIGKFYQKYKGNSCSILIYTVTPEQETLLVARISDAYIPDEDELRGIFRKYEDSGWLDDMRTDIEIIGGDLKAINDPKPVEIANIRFRPENVQIFDPMLRVTGNYRFARKPRFYHPFNWDGILPDTEVSPPPHDEIDPTRSERERTRAAQEGTRVDPRHVRLQNRLYRCLCQKYGKSNVWYENSYVDLTLKESIGCTYFEIKMESTAKRCIRSALGQLLEYAHYPTHSRAKRLVVVGDARPTDTDRQYVSYLRDKYHIPLYYRQFHWEANELGDEI